MPDDESSLEATDLPIVLYLNQRLTFDLLAALEGGFSHFRTVQVSSSDKSNTSVSGDASLGASNVFALLGVNLRGRLARNRDASQTETATEGLVHTPASLFARLRSELRARDLVHHMSGCHDIGNISPGSFVEFEATLHRSGLVETLRSLDSLFQMIEDFGEVTQDPRPRGGKKNSPEKAGNKPKNDARKTIELFLKSIIGAGSQDFLARASDQTNIVITADTEYFVDNTMKDVLDGTFRVFGKVTRVVSDPSDSINLLRSSPLGKLEKVNQVIIDAIDKLTEIPELGIRELEIEVRGPTAQVVPVAIFS